MRRLLAGLFLSAAPLLVAQQAITLPPRRVAFDATVPTDVLVGKLWWDLGLFHPFTGEVSRDAWEKAYFGLMNKAVEPGANAAALAAEAVGLLKDPASLLLESGEGQGGNFLPILWEVKGNQAWIIGGAADQVAEPFGPVDSINGRPLGEFLGKRLGSFRSDDRSYAALTLASRRTNAFQVEFGAGTTKVIIKSVDSLKAVKDPWIRGGWQGRPFFGADQARFRSMAEIKAMKGGINLQQSPWQPISATQTLGDILILLGAECPLVETVRVVREHRGQYDEDWDRYALDSASFNRVAAYPAPNRMAWVEPGAPVGVALPQVVLDEGLAEVLAGWAFPATSNVCAKSVRYNLLPGWDVRLRTESWCASLNNAKHQATYQNGGILTVDAAKALAAATIINWDHLFSFTPESMQVGVFKAALAARSWASDTMDMIQRAGGITKDAHSAVFTAIPYEDVLQKFRGNVVYPEKSVASVTPHFPGYEMANGEIRLLRSLRGGPSAGMIIEKVNGVDLAGLVKEIRPHAPIRPEHRDIVVSDHLDIGGKLGKPIPNSFFGLPPAVLEVRGEKGELKTFRLPNPVVDDSMYEGAPETLEGGWKLLKRPSMLELTKALENGEKVIVDARVYAPMALSANWGLPAPYPSPSHGGYRHTPSAPMAWGVASTDKIWERETDATFAVRGYVQPVPAMTKTLPGSLMVLVSGATLSRPETVAAYLKEAFPQNCKLVGLPTGGSMGSRGFLALPIGGGKPSLAIFSPTVSMNLINGRNWNFRGLPLDREIKEAELLNEMKSGSVDPLLTAAAKAVVR